jgi:hypothetical protein
MLHTIKPYECPRYFNVGSRPSQRKELKGIFCITSLGLRPRTRAVWCIVHLCLHFIASTSFRSAWHDWPAPLGCSRLFVSKFTCARASQLCVIQRHCRSASCPVLVDCSHTYGVVVDASERFPARFVWPHPAYSLGFAVFFSAHLVLLVAWLACHPCRTWCNIIYASFWVCYVWFRVAFAV